jgi:hypothetical protein
VREYDAAQYPMPSEEAVGVDERVTAVNRLVDLERQYALMQRDTEDLQKRTAIVGQELREVRQGLAEMLGLAGVGQNKKADW